MIYYASSPKGRVFDYPLGGRRLERINQENHGDHVDLRYYLFVYFIIFGHVSVKRYPVGQGSSGSHMIW